MKTKKTDLDLKKRLPKKGDKIYVDDEPAERTDTSVFLGGKATVVKIKKIGKGKNAYHLITTKEHPHVSTPWEGALETEQEELRKKFKNKVARSEPNFPE